MSKLAPIFNDAQLIDGIPASGAKMFTYAAGSSTKQTTFKDKAGTTPQANPIVLNTRGEPDSPIHLTEGLEYKFVFAPSTDADPPTSAIRTIDNISGVNDASVAIDQWIESGSTPTYVSATQFTVPGDKVSTFQVNRRIKCSVTAGTVYGYVSASAYNGSTLTTVTVVLDSGNLDVGLSAVQVGLLTADNPSYVAYDRMPISGGTFTGDVSMDSSTIIMSKGASVASATSLPLTTDGNTFNVTGTTDIESIVSIGVGAIINLIFDDVLTLTHDATNFILLTGDDVTTEAGDVAEFLEYAAGDWRMISYSRASGAAVGSSEWTISSQFAYANGSFVEATHGGVTEPDEWEARVICTTAQTGFSVGDDFKLSSWGYSNFGQSVCPEGTTKLRVSIGTSGIDIVQKAGGATRILIPANFRIYFKYKWNA